MLIEFRVENHRSLRDEQALTMEVGRIGDSTDERPRNVAGYAEELLPVAAIYGANASGKTNVLSALAFMRNTVLFSHRNWEPEGGVPREAFAWGKKDEPSFFEVTALIDAVRYQYGFETDSQSFLEEWLYAWPNGKKQVWFERDANEFKYGENLKGDNPKGIHKLIEEVTRPNALYLSAAAQHRHQQLTRIFNWFRDLRPVNVTSSRSAFGPSVSLRQASLLRLLEGLEVKQRPLPFDDEEIVNLADQFKDMVRNADFGILDMRVLKNDSDEMPKYSRARIQLRHKSSVEDAWLPLEEESQGTQKLFQMAIPVLQTLRDGAVMIVDELEASLHPALAQKIVELFNKPEKNPRHAQLVFTTHDTNLLGTTLGTPVLRRDQVWLTEKDTEGGTALYPLTDYHPRKSENVERGYLQGRYGAIPFLGKFAWPNEDPPDEQTPRPAAEAGETPAVSEPEAPPPGGL